MVPKPTLIDIFKNALGKKFNHFEKKILIKIKYNDPKHIKMFKHFCNNIIHYLIENKISIYEFTISDFDIIYNCNFASLEASNTLKIAMKNFAFENKNIHNIKNTSMTYLSLMNYKTFLYSYMHTILVTYSN